MPWFYAQDAWVQCAWAHSDAGRAPVAALLEREHVLPALDIARLHAALDGDAAALAQLVDVATPVVQARVARALLRRAQSRGRDISQEVADLTQEVFLALFVDDAKALRAWNPALGLSLPNFIGLLAQRRVASIMRVRRRAPWSETPGGDDLDPGPTADSESPDARLFSRDLLERLFEALEASLSPRGLQLFYMLYVNELSIEETCARSGLNPGAVYQWKSRLGQAAREALRELQEDAGATSRPTRRPATNPGALQSALDEEEAS
jgi:RNA polymerase sigma factor (sigma-70 family)